MLSRNRQTQRVRHRDGARRTLRQSHITQIGGAGADADSWYYYISDTARAADWNKALPTDSDLAQFANKITAPGWGLTSPSERLKLYVQLVERQDKLFRMALNIIYAKLRLNPQSETLETDIMTYISTNGGIPNEAALKEYLKDVFSLITGVKGDTAMKDILKITGTKNEKIARLYADPLSQILMWPERVSNVFVEYIARTLVELKKSQEELDAIVRQRNPLVRNGLIQTFATSRTAYMLTNTILLTSMSMRDGFYINQVVDIEMSLVPVDNCPNDTDGTCNLSEVADRSFWALFASHLVGNNDYKTVEALSTDMKALKNILYATFSRLTAYIYTLYKSGTSISEIRNNILTRKDFTTVEPKFTSTAKPPTYRPQDAIDLYATDNLAKTLCSFHPSQYSYLLHLLYTMEEFERAGKTSSGTAPPAPQPPAAAAAALSASAAPSSSVTPPLPHPTLSEQAAAVAKEQTAAAKKKAEEEAAAPPPPEVEAKAKGAKRITRTSAKAAAAAPPQPEAATPLEAKKSDAAAAPPPPADKKPATGTTRSAKAEAKAAASAKGGP